MNKDKVLNLVECKHKEMHGDLSIDSWRKNPEFSGIDTEMYAIGATDHYTLSHMIYHMPESALRYSVLALGEKARALDMEAINATESHKAEMKMLRDHNEVLQAKIKS